MSWPTTHQRRRVGRQKELERGPDGRVQDMPTPGDPVFRNHDRVDVNGGLAVNESNVADEGCDFGLLVHGQVAIGLVLLVEPPEQAALDRAYGGKIRGDKPLALREGGHAAHDLVALTENHRITAHPPFGPPD